MKKFFFAGMVLLACAIFMFNGCSKGGDDGGGSGGFTTDDFISDVSFTWTAQNGDNFFFFTDSTNVAKTNFTGNDEFLGGGDEHFAGSMFHEKVQFTFTDGGDSGKSFRGKIDTLHPTYMRLANVADSLRDSLILHQHQ